MMDQPTVHKISNSPCEHIMPKTLHWKRKWLVILAFIVGVTIFFAISMLNKQGSKTNMILPELMEIPQKKPYSVWPEFAPRTGFNREYFQKCVTMKEHSIIGIADMLDEWGRSTDHICREMFVKFTSVFKLEKRSAQLSLPKPMIEKVKGWLGNNNLLFREVYNQTVVYVNSLLSREQTVFNPLRDKRPTIPVKFSEEEYVNNMVKETQATCDFCNFKKYTAEHIFGRVESKYAFSASNVFKIDSLHALLVLKSHHPLNWNQEQFVDLMKLTSTWLKKAHKHHPKGQFPAMIWDVLPKCGASQVHPHMHVMLDPSRYPGDVENWREGAQEYFSKFGSNYFSDLLSFYAALNLTVTYETATAFANMAPKKDHEIVVMAKKPGEDFYKLLYFVLRAFVDDLHKYCFSMGVGLPALDNRHGEIPAFARIITRGAVTDIRADMSSLELFTATNVNIDPYKTIGYIRESVKKRSGL